MSRENKINLSNPFNSVSRVGEIEYKFLFEEVNNVDWTNVDRSLGWD